MRKGLGLAATVALVGVCLFLLGRRDERAKPVSSHTERGAPPSDERSDAVIARVRRPPPAPAKPPTRVASAPPEDRTVRGAPAEKVFEAKWGGAPTELGRKEANESSPEGPMSFVVDERGRALVLDQVNSRVQIFETGKQPRSVQLPGDTFQDLAVTASDGIVALDRLTTASLAFVDSSGKLTHEVGLEGKGVPEPGQITGLFQRDDGTWVEVNHANLVRVADGEQNADLERPILQGRPTADGTAILRASRSGDRAVYVAEKRGDRPVQALARIEFDMPVYQLLALETDRRGRIFLGASLLEERAVEPFDVLRSSEQVIVLAANGAELSRIELPETHDADESFRRIRVGGDGFLYQLTTGRDGATLWRVKP
jgi:hypothetical protein